MPLNELSESDRALLRQAALEALRLAVLHRQKPTKGCFAPGSEKLSAMGACFVTLLKQGRLRGCIGTLEACRPLLDDVIHNTYSAAIEDPRFPPVGSDELDLIELSISVLTEPQEMIVTSESQLLSQIVPGVDGIILQEGHHRATYLPSVWEQLPAAEDFVRELKCKAGLPSDYWSDTIRCFRYQVQSIS